MDRRGLTQPDPHNTLGRYLDGQMRIVGDLAFGPLSRLGRFQARRTPYLPVFVYSGMGPSLLVVPKQGTRLWQSVIVHRIELVILCAVCPRLCIAVSSGRDPSQVRVSVTPHLGCISPGAERLGDP